MRPKIRVMNKEEVNLKGFPLCRRHRSALRPTASSDRCFQCSWLCGKVPLDFVYLIKTVIRVDI